MATITGTVTRPNPVYDAWVISWPSMGNADNGTPASLLSASEKSVQVTGTFGSATVILQGSNDGSNWRTLSDPQGNAISFTSAGLEAVLEHTRYIRPNTSGGTGTDVTVTVFAKGQVL